MKSLSSKLLTLQAIETIVNAIQNNDNQEVSFSGLADEEGVIDEVTVLSYGNDTAAVVDMMATLKADVLIHNHPSSDLRASMADIELASLLVNLKIGFYIVDNECNYVNIIHPVNPKIPLKEKEISDIFSRGGLLSQNISEYESREEQIRLVRDMSRAINTNALLISEAGTGTGKSLSYLIPTAIWAIQNEKRVIITTHTINLQQQIAGKDMSIVNRIVKSYTGQPIDSAILIGKRNYLCKKKLYDILKDSDRQESLFDDQNSNTLLLKLEEWSRSAKEGTRAEFPEFVKNDLWEEIGTDSMTCTRKKCNWYGDCFYFKARLQAEKANLIIANHSLLLSSIDKESYKSALPHFSGVVFDEAHHLEDVALKSMSKEFSVQGLLYQFRKLYSRRKKSKIGLLPLCWKKAGLHGFPEVQAEYETILKAISEATSDTHEFFSDAMEFLHKSYPDSQNIGIDQNFTETDQFDWLEQRLDSIFSRLSRLSTRFGQWSERIKKISSNPTVAETLQATQYRMINLSEFQIIFDLIFHSPEESGIVRWIERSPRNLKFSYSPVEIEDFLVNALFSKKEFTLFTSATLIINKKFDYFKNSVGLPLLKEKPLIETSIDSPFDYQKQAELFILKEEVSHRETSREKNRLIQELALASRGGTLVLFTSYQRLIQVFETLKDDLMENGLLPIRQGEKSREELLGIMQRRSYGVLFATSSFWEGIDIQGDNLRCVIIEKLPFESPADPIYKAKAALLESRGVNPFMGYAVPRAVLRLKQGLGRLIRSKTDRGLMVILDNRLKTKRYGKIFLDSLPSAEVFYEEGEDLIRKGQEFFTRRF